MEEPKHLSEMMKNNLSYPKPFNSSVIKNNFDYSLDSFQEAKVIDAYFAPSYVQKHEDLHLWFETTKGHYEFLLSDVVKTDKFFSSAEKVVATDFIGDKYVISLSENKLTKNKLVSSVIINIYLNAFNPL